ncbi:MAG: NAD(P)-dependent oxidoreductase [Butyrivibrio sp.]|nr:NAD(P)-dependent oxidoreductase [Butyrivibrio sp.]
MSKLCVLVTGVGGFIGQNVAEYLLGHNMEVIGIYHRNEPTDLRGMERFACDLAKTSVEKYVNDKNINAIIHFAGQMRGDKIRNYLDNTIGSTRQLIDYAQREKIRTFIYISSISVYGETLHTVNEDSDRINMDDYGMTKYLCERMLEDSCIENRIVIRLPRTLGKGCDLSYPWIPKVTGQMLKNEDVYYMNPNLLYNNMLYVDDLSKFLLYLLHENKSGFDRFVLGAKGQMRIFDILERLKECLGSSSMLIEKTASGRNKCYAIDTTYAEEHGFVSRKIDKIIEKFAHDMKMF